MMICQTHLGPICVLMCRCIYHISMETGFTCPFVFGMCCVQYEGCCVKYEQNVHVLCALRGIHMKQNNNNENKH